MKKIEERSKDIHLTIRDDKDDAEWRIRNMPRKDFDIIYDVIEMLVGPDANKTSKENLRKLIIPLADKFWKN